MDNDVTEFKQKLVDKLIFCNEEAKKLERESINKQLEKIHIQEEGNEICIQFEKQEVTSPKNNSLKVISFCCIIAKFLSQMLEILEQEISNSSFDARLVRLYVQFEEILNDIFEQ